MRCAKTLTRLDASVSHLVYHRLRRGRPSLLRLDSGFTASYSSMASTPGTDYGNWSHEDLIKRVTQLESELKAQQERLTSLLPQPAAEPAPAAEVTTAKKKTKKHTPFDPSKYTTRYIALKFAYLGARYNGFEHHIGNATPLPTIEEELWKALVKTRLIFPPSLYGEDGAPLLSGKAGVEEVERLPAGVVGDWTGCEYSKCGRTDRGVSAFGQVIGLRVRSARPKEKVKKAKKEKDEEVEAANVGEGKDSTDALGAMTTLPGSAQEDSGHSYHNMEGVEEREGEVEDDKPPRFDPVKDELPYLVLLNRVLPPDIRVLAWCPNTPPNFDARFSCKERKYRYFFTSPAFLPLPGAAGISPRTSGREGWLDIDAMREAASYLVGTHDFRNLCKVDPSKQLTSFTRRITDARIVEVGEVGGLDFVKMAHLTDTAFSEEGKRVPASKGMRLFSFDVQGSAFLWHQVRCMVAILFLVGQGLEKPSVVKELLDVKKNPCKPHYEMASDQPLVLWDCMFSADPDKGRFNEEDRQQSKGYVDRGVGEDELEWVYAADSGPGTSNQVKWGPLGLMTDLWKGWRKAKMDEVLAAQLLDMVSTQGRNDGVDSRGPVPAPDRSGKENQRVFEGHDSALPRGKYVPVMQRPLMEPVEVINAKWAARKGRPPRFASSVADDGRD
ncbi:tRNA pseudouridine(38-40) synthase [Verruconis gallopava]|uniref:tRNA pseudouridine(38-40) synthase n=1 Tax=Verruconis gallopava TaxID=253628 RepID=A0A0D2A6K1_9PEZI|nr:tRNA pseudouridine(38-40) synthase [Verruconis gallopava]KIW02205.1 tRNA pseudouridine(38-40) synthase [Verruconis gallopava]